MSTNSRYSQYFKAAKNSLIREQYGDALAHMVFIANVEPSMRKVLEEDFIVALRHWVEILERHGELEKLMVCLQEALKLYPQSENILINAGASLLKLGFSDEAASCFRRALQVNPMNLRAKENLENLKNLLVERWHFRMLNDKQRNTAYKQAVCRAISQGHNTVLDIGSGTGILSMFAVQGGAEEVYACEMSKTMYEMGHDVLKANKMETQVHTIHKKSTDMKVGDDIPKRVSLVVTETLDCGLLGEGILTTIEHAWTHLLLPSKGSALQQSDFNPVSKVIPGGAVMFAVVIMCDDIKNQSRCKPFMCGLRMFPECSIGGEVMEQKTKVTSSINVWDQLEPYNTECLNNLRGGFTLLSSPFKVAEFNFNDPSSLCRERDLHLEIQAANDGRVDAIAAWFDLLLDDETTLSTAPDDNSLCWEQAIFPFHLDRKDHEVSKGDLLSVHGHISQDCMRLTFGGILSEGNVAKEKVHLKDADSMVEKSTSLGDVTIIPSSYMRRLNDEVFNELYEDVICSAIKGLKPEFYSVSHLNNGLKSVEGTNECNVLDITCGPSLFSLFASRGQADCILMCTPHKATWTDHILTGNGLPSVIEYGPKRLEEIAKDGTDRRWNVLISDVVEPSGTLRQQVIEDVVFARGCLLTPGKFQILPMGFTLYCMCIESPFLFANCCIIDEDNTLGLDIGRFVNEFQVSTQVDLDLTNLPFTALTENITLFSLNFMEDFADNHKVLSMLETRCEQKVKVVKSGKIHAIPYWFMMHVDTKHSLSTYSGAYTESHWRQAALILKDEMCVEAGQELLISASCVNSNIFINVNVIKC